MKNALLYIRELRNRTLSCLICFLLFFCAAFYFSDKLSDFIITPLVATGTIPGFVYTGLAEAFVSKINIAIFFAICGTIPVILLQTYLFISPALYTREKIFLLMLLLSVAFLFFFGLFICVMFVLPWACKFFTDFQYRQDQSSLILMPKISEYINFFVSCAGAFGIAFQIPVLLVILMYINVIHYSTLQRCRKPIIVVIFILAAILTPPDIISQIILAIPMIILYELSILIGKSIIKQR